MDYDWIPSIRLGPLGFNQEIAGLVETGAVVPLKYDDDSTGWDTYSYKGDATRVHVEDGRIVSVGCYEQCIFQEKNLIGLPYDTVQTLIGLPPDSTPDTIEIDDHPQQVFEFEDVGAQVWVRDGFVVTIFCNDASDE